MLDYLKTKVTSLGAEAKLIRQYERQRFKKASKSFRTGRLRQEGYHLKVANGLREHRLFVVQPEARNANIAYGFLRGRAYKDIEWSCRRAGEPAWDRIEKLVLTFAERDNPRYNSTVEERFKEWVAQAQFHLKHSYELPECLEVKSIGNNQIGYMEPNSEYQLNLKSKRRAAYVPNTVCLDSEQGI